MLPRVKAVLKVDITTGPLFFLIFYLLVPKIDILLDKNPQKPPLHWVTLLYPPQSTFPQIPSMPQWVSGPNSSMYLINRDSLFTLYFYHDSIHIRFLHTSD